MAQSLEGQAWDGCRGSSESIAESPGYLAVEAIVSLMPGGLGLGWRELGWALPLMSDPQQDWETAIKHGLAL